MEVHQTSETEVPGSNPAFTPTPTPEASIWNRRTGSRRKGNSGVGNRRTGNRRKGNKSKAKYSKFISKLFHSKRNKS